MKVEGLIADELDDAAFRLVGVLDVFAFFVGFE